MPFVRVDLEVAKKWAADSSNVAELRPTFRHILVKVSEGDPTRDAAARKKIDGILARLVAGEDMATLAPRFSDDPGSAKKGGAYPGQMVMNFVEEARRSYESLRPGTFTREPVKTVFGWHIIAKDALDEESTIASYKYAFAKKTAATIAKDLHGRLHHVVPGGVVGTMQQAFSVIPGWPSERTPTVNRLPADAPSLASSCKDLVSMAHDGTVRTTWHDRQMVATFTDDPLDPHEEEGSTCSATSSENAITPERVRELLERARRKSEK